MPSPQKLLQRLDAIGRAVAASGQGLAVIGLGSVGAALDRLDAYSDLDFFVIVQPGAKQAFLTHLAWLESEAPLVYSFMNTVDGYKLLYDDGIFAEMAIFEPGELAQIPFSGGRFIWRAPGFTLPVPLSGNRLPAELSPSAALPSTTWQINELLTNLYVGLGRFQRGEKLSAARFIQGHAVDRLVALAPHLETAPPAEPARPSDRDAFDPARRFEQTYPQTAAHLPAFMPGYDESPAAARAMLAFLDQRFEINPAMKAAILSRCL
jgi:lincosamide nucleotidyltransferase